MKISVANLKEICVGQGIFALKNLIWHGITQGPIRCHHYRPEWIWEWWQWRGTMHSPKPQHYWNLTIRLFSIISRTLILAPLQRSSVYSTAPADWARKKTWSKECWSGDEEVEKPGIRQRKKGRGKKKNEEKRRRKAESLQWINEKKRDIKRKRNNYKT